MTPSNPPLGLESALRRLLGRARSALGTPAPGYSRQQYTPEECRPEEHILPGPDLRQQRWRRLDRARDLLEQAHTVIGRDGWTSGAWFSVSRPSGGVRRVSGMEALAYRDPEASVVSSCLVGTLVRLADDSDTAATVADAWTCVDELYEAMHEQLGHASRPPGRSFSPAERRSRLQGLTAWNDAPGRTREQVLDLLDRAVSRTILAAVR